MIFDSKETRLLVLSEFLKICVFDGWNSQALLKAVNACKIDEKFLPIIFENGALDVANFYLEIQNEKMTDKILEIENFHQDKIRNKIRLALYARFEIEDKMILRRLSNFYLNIKNFTNFDNGAKPLFYGLGASFKTSDIIWKALNDQSTDFNFYTKRLTLAKIIFRTALIFLKDESVDLQKTKNFIDLEIEKVMKFEKCKANVKKAFNKNFLNDDGKIKSPKEILRSLPFFRLTKF